MSRYENPWRWIKIPEPDGKKRITMLVGGCMPAAYNLFHKLDELTEGYDEIIIYGFEPTGGNRSESRLYGCLKAWCAKTGNEFKAINIKEFDSLSGYMQFMADDAEHAAIALYGNGYSKTLDVIKGFENDICVTYRQFNGSYAT